MRVATAGANCNQWHQAIPDRKARRPKVLDEKLIEDTARVISDFPHFGGAKGQAYMLYHGMVRKPMTALKRKSNVC